MKHQKTQAEKLEVLNIDFWDTLPQELKDEIQMGIQEIEKGETVDYDDIISKHRK